MSNEVQLTGFPESASVHGAIQSLAEASSSALKVSIGKWSVLSEEGQRQFGNLLGVVEKVFPDFLSKFPRPENPEVLGIHLAAHLADKLNTVDALQLAFINRLSEFLDKLPRLTEMQAQAIKVIPNGDGLPFIRGPGGNLFALTLTDSPDKSVIPEEHACHLRMASDPQAMISRATGSRIFVNSGKLELPEDGQLIVNRAVIPAFELVTTGTGSTLRPCVVNLSKGQPWRALEHNLPDNLKVETYEVVGDRCIVAWTIHSQNSQRMGVLFYYSPGEIFPCKSSEGQFITTDLRPEIISTASGDIIAYIIPSESRIGYELLNPPLNMRFPLAKAKKEGDTISGPILLPGSKTLIVFGVVGEKCEFEICDTVTGFKFSLSECKPDDLFPKRVQYVLIDCKRGQERRSVRVSSIRLFGEGRDKDGHEICFEADLVTRTIRKAPYRVLSMYSCNDTGTVSKPAGVFWKGEKQEYRVIRIDSTARDRCQALIESTIGQSEGDRYLVTLRE